MLWLRALSSTWAKGELPEAQGEDWLPDQPHLQAGQEACLQPSLRPLVTKIHFIDSWGFFREEALRKYLPPEAYMLVMETARKTENYKREGQG